MSNAVAGPDKSRGATSAGEEEGFGTTAPRSGNNSGHRLLELVVTGGGNPPRLVASSSHSIATSASASASASSRRRNNRRWRSRQGSGSIGGDGIDAFSRSRSSWRSDDDDEVNEQGGDNDGWDDVDLEKNGAEARAGFAIAATTARPSLSDLARQFGGSLLLALLSWNVPRYLIANETSIATQPAPYQVVGNRAQQQEWVVLNPDLNHPLVDPPTIPSDLLVCTSLGAPLLVILLVGWVTMPPLTSLRDLFGSARYASLPQQRPNDDDGRDAATAATTAALSEWLGTLHAALCGAMMTVALAEGPTQLLKLYVQRPRPNYYQLCGFDMKSRTCTAPLDERRDATFSFPSGHSSLAAASMTYASLYLLSRILHTPCSSSGGRGRARWCLYRRTWALLSVILPLSWSVFVGASRIVDHWHHPGDVLAGLALGHVAALLSYHYWFPPIWIATTLPWSIFQRSSSKQ